jgi:hypothetical protein
VQKSGIELFPWTALLNRVSKTAAVYGDMKSVVDAQIVQFVLLPKSYCKSVKICPFESGEIAVEWRIPIIFHTNIGARPQ